MLELQNEEINEEKILAVQDATYAVLLQKKNLKKFRLARI